MDRSSGFTSLCRNLALAACFAALLPLSSHAQARPSADKSADISAFAGFTEVWPDYGLAKNRGVTFGANYTRYFPIPIAPSIEFRYGYTTGNTVSERTLLVGLRAEKDFDGPRFHRVHPYANFLAGTGNITYATPPIPNYTRDTGPVFSFGGGADFDLLRNFRLKADFQAQSWNLGINGVLKPQGGNYTLTPYALTLGVTYVVPWRKYNQPAR